MPVLTEDQVFEAALELHDTELSEVLECIEEQRAVSLDLSDEYKQLIRDEIEAHRHNPSTAISRDELMSKMQAAR